VKVPYALSLEPSDTLPLESWIRNEGFAHTVKRLKSLKTWAVQVIGGEREFSIPWIAKTKYKGILVPKYHLFETLVDALESSNWKVVRTLLAYLSSYKMYRPCIGSLTSITDTPKIDLDDHYLDKLLLYVDLPRIPKSALEREEAILKGSSHARDQGITESGPMGSLETPIWKLMYPEDGLPDSIGRLKVVPDKGKARVILIGHWLVQVKTKRLADWLRKYLWTLPEIASGDQTKMSEFVKARMSKGWKFASIDQSEATDRLSRSTQVKVLERMGMPSDFLEDLELPFWYDPKEFGEPDPGYLKLASYSNGQPMGLYISFPMFELLHYICAVVASATTNTEFSICGDDIVFSAPTLKEIQETSRRYIDLIVSLGGKINTLKTITGDIAEAIGALFVRNGCNVMEIHTPSGQISPVELTVGSWVADQVRRGTRIGRAIEYSFLSPAEVNRYTYQDRREFWRWILTSKTDLTKSAINSLLSELSHEPQEWSALEKDPGPFARSIGSQRPKPFRLHPVSRRTLDDARLTTRIKSLYTKEKCNAQE
jgi:hypothetical protein